MTTHNHPVQAVVYELFGLELSLMFLPSGYAVQSLVYNMYMEGTITRVSIVAMPSP